MPDQSYTLRPQRRWRSRIVLLLLLLALLAVGVWWIWLISATHQYEAALARLRQASLPSSFEEHLRDLKPVPEDLNAALDIAAAAELIDTGTAAYKALNDWRIPVTEMTDEDRERWVAIQAEVVREQAAAIERAAKVDSRIRPAVDAVRADFGTWSDLKAQIAAGNLPNDPIAIALPNLLTVRNVGKVLAADGRAAIAAGDGARGLRQVIRIIGVADATDFDGHTLIEHLVAIGLRVTAANVAMEASRVAAAEGVPREVRASAIAVLYDDSASRAGYAKAIRGELAFQMEAMRALDEGRISIIELAEDVQELAGEEAKAGNRRSKLIGRLLTALTRPILRGDAAQVADFFRGWYAAAEIGDWPTARRNTPDEEAVATLEWWDLYASLLLPSLGRSTEAEYRSRTDMHLAATTLAIAAYRADNGGEWPRSLEALVPRYLPALPRDAMAEGEAPIRYDAQRKLLWSVGTDGIDNDGDASSMRQGGGKASHWDGKDAVVELE